MTHTEYGECKDITADMCCDGNATCTDLTGVEAQCTCDTGFFDVNGDGMRCGK